MTNKVENNGSKSIFAIWKASGTCSTQEERVVAFSNFKRSIIRFSLFSAAIAIFMMLLSFIVAYSVHTSMPESISSTYSAISQTYDHTNVRNPDESISFFLLVFHNACTAGTSLLTGLVPFLYFPCVMTAVNGAVIGILGSLYNVSNIPAIVFAAGILPHGIFEFPAIWIASGCGLALCRQCEIHWKELNPSKKTDAKNTLPRTIGFSDALKYVLKIFFFVSIPLLIVAAAIETYITPQLMQMAMSSVGMA